MDSESFKQQGAQLLDYVTTYHENIRDRCVFPDVKPGFLRELIPVKPPEQPESWETVFGDIERVIMPGLVHYQSPRRFSFWTLATSFPSILGELLTNAIGCLGPTWEACPMSVELEMQMMDWMARMLTLPDPFLFSDPGKGGGIILANASEATLTSLLAARTLTFRKQQQNQGQSHGDDVTLGHVLDKMVAYCSDQAHLSVEKAGMIAGVRMRLLPTDEKGSLHGVTLEAAILEDRAKGFIPFYFCATLGSVETCSFDNLKELGPICDTHHLWMHVDSAYAGSAFICPEFRPLLEGVEYATSFNFNAHKWMKITYECSPFWVKNTEHLRDNFPVERRYLEENSGGGSMPDFRHWQIAATSHPCRALKVWFVLRLFGLTGLQSYIRHDVQMAHELETLLRADDRFEIPADVIMGLVCFRLKGSNEKSERLLQTIQKEGQILLIPARFKGLFILRLAVCGPYTLSADVTFAADVIKRAADVTMSAGQQ